MKVRCGRDTYVKRDGTVGTAGKGALVNPEQAFTISAMQDQHVVAMASGQANAEVTEDGTSPTVTCLHEQPIAVYGDAGDDMAVEIADGTRWVARRLTPVECERLQGFPDGWTDVEYRGKPAPDTKRYKALGNSMAVPVMRWIGERIGMVEGILRAHESAR